MLILFSIPALLFVGAGLAWRGRAPRTGFCGSCGYDLRGGSTLRCPECGHEHASRSQLVYPRRLRALARTLLAAGVLALVASVALNFHWTLLVPRPLMALLLDALVPAPPGTPLPAPNPALQYSSDRWERLVWQQQVARSIDAWAARAVAPRRGATLAEIEALIPAAEQISRLFDQTGGTRWEESWPVKRAVTRLQAAAEHARTALSAEPAGRVAAKAENEIAFDRGVWALSELQFEGADYTHRPDWASAPPELLLALLGSGKPALQTFALERIGRFQERLAEVMPAVRGLAASAPDAGVRSRAEALAGWMDQFGPQGARRPASEGAGNGGGGSGEGKAPAAATR